MKKNNILFGIVLGFTIVLIFVMLGLIYLKINQGEIHYNDVSDDGGFSTAFIQQSHATLKNKNYMVSPYSVEIALSMLREGANGETLDELNKVVPKRNIKTLIVKNKVNVANAVFIKDIYKKDLLPSYMDTLDQEYNADVVYDAFRTPDKINNWVNQETHGMIPKILDSMDPDFVLGIANAVAMEEEWKNPFECESTTGYAFTQRDGKQFDTAMMFQSYENDASYYKNDEMESVILPYTIYNRETGKEDEEGEQLDFIGILPKDLDSYVEDLSMDDVTEIVEHSRTVNDRLEITVGLPRFEFDFDYKQFKKTLNKMGIKNVFNPGCDLSNMIENHPDSYVNEAIHKTYVKVDEAGTKAAAVTYFGIKDNAAISTEDVEYVSVIFDKPFVFMIKDHKTNEILFFGVVYEPEKWDGKKSCE